ncbi:MAG: hypothetical protein WD889_01455 [Candidatus Colwellbacteria bacterium]
MPRYFRSSDLAHEIASAVFRVAALTRHERLRKELEEAAIDLVKSICPENADTLERLVQLTEAAGEVSEINAMVLCRELGNLRIMLNAEISESFSGVSANLNLQEIFAEKGVSKGGEGKQGIWSQKERQKAVLGYIRKFPSGCRMRQLSATFPDFSERTIRTDVQRLIGKGLVEKTGSKTGPFSYFKHVDSPGFQPREAGLPAGAPVTKEEPFSL